MVDDLKTDAVLAMRETGFNPAAIVETSPGNFQAWMKHPERLSKEVSTAPWRRSSAVITAQPTGGTLDA